jgi:hypothetical protein
MADFIRLAILVPVGSLFSGTIELFGKVVRGG